MYHYQDNFTLLFNNLRSNPSVTERFIKKKFFDKFADVTKTR